MQEITLAICALKGKNMANFALSCISEGQKKEEEDREEIGKRGNNGVERRCLRGACAKKGGRLGSRRLLIWSKLFKRVIRPNRPVCFTVAALVWH